MYDTKCRSTWVSEIPMKWYPYDNELLSPFYFHLWMDLGIYKYYILNCHNQQIQLPNNVWFMLFISRNCVRLCIFSFFCNFILKLWMKMKIVIWFFFAILTFNNNIQRTTHTHTQKIPKILNFLNFHPSSFFCVFLFSFLSLFSFYFPFGAFVFCFSFCFCSRLTFVFF